jgi:hypothetical protein
MLVLEDTAVTVGIGATLTEATAVADPQALVPVTVYAVLAFGVTEMVATDWPELHE